MRPVPAAIGWDVPPIESVKDLAEWLGLDVSDLLWFADLKGLGNKSRSQRLSHYHFRLLLKASGHVRLIEVPKPRLKDLQRQILFHILKEIPPHPSVHGFVRGRSIKSFVAPHVGRRCVLRMDLRDFFPSFPAARIAAFFRTAGYPDAVAHVLAGICTNAAPASLWIRHRKGITPTVLRDARDLYSRPHLPQGAATSPALANLCTYRLDCRLSGLAEATGVSYTRYADDLAFSGDYEFERRAERFSTHVAEILLEEGFSVSHRKTRIMRSGVRQHLAGLVTNLTCNVPRPDFDRLKATLTNCLRHGPETQNRSSNPQFRAHLEGRVSFLESIHAVKGARLRAIFNQIHWPADQSTPPGSQEYS